jgi:sarcosine oxidase subunit gamma
MGAEFQGYATVREAGLMGMISLRADLADTKVMAAIKSATGVKVPAVRRMDAASNTSVGWMSPDELLILCPYAQAGALVTALTERLAGLHHLVVDVSDARALFRLEGPAAREVLAKLTPTDLAPGKFEPGELRRTRLAQVPAAFWVDEVGFSIVAFRSVAQYVFDLLKISATPGGEVGLWV